MKLYTTHQFDLAEGHQVRITGGTRTLYVFRNARGVHVSLGGYRNGKRARGAKRKKYVHWRTQRKLMDKMIQAGW